MSENIQISIIICTHNRANYLFDTLNSLSKVKIPEEKNVELLVVNNASKDDTDKIVHSYKHPSIKIRYLSEPIPGKSRALNLAIKESSGEVLLFTDDDVRFSEHWIERMCDPILNGKTDAVAGGIKLAQQLEESWMTSVHKLILGSADSKVLVKGKQFFGANMAISKKAINKTSGYDQMLGPGGQGLGNAEDTLLGWQIRKAGFKILPRPEVVVEHYPDSSILNRSSLLNRAKRLGRSEAYISYHWQHTNWNLFFLYSGIVVHSLKLSLKRMLSKSEELNKGIPTWEFNLVRKISRLKQHIKEHKKEQYYEKYGLIKKI